MQDKGYRIKGSDSNKFYAAVKADFMMSIRGRSGVLQSRGSFSLYPDVNHLKFQ